MTRELTSAEEQLLIEMLNNSFHETLVRSQVKAAAFFKKYLNEENHLNDMRKIAFNALEVTE